MKSVNRFATPAKQFIEAFQLQKANGHSPEAWELDAAKHALNGPIVSGWWVQNQVDHGVHKVAAQTNWQYGVVEKFFEQIEGSDTYQLTDRGRAIFQAMVDIFDEVKAPDFYAHASKGTYDKTKAQEALTRYYQEKGK